MNKVEITKEMLTAARDYLPNAEKELWVAQTAPKCFDRLEVKIDDEPMPTMYMANEGLRRRYLMGAFATLYFASEIEAEERDDALMTEDCYDAWAGGHVFNQIERWKRDAGLRDKCFDLLADYKDLEKRFSAQIAGLLAVQNDPVLRQAQYSSASIKELPGLLEQLKALQEKKDGEANA